MKATNVKYLQKKIHKINKRKNSVKIKDLIDANLGNALSVLSQKEVDAKTAFKIAEILEEKKRHMLVFEAARKSLLDRFGSKGEDGQLLLNEARTEYVIPEEVRDEYQKEHDDLLEVEVLVSTFDKSCLERVTSITPAQVLALKPIIK